MAGGQNAFTGFKPLTTELYDPATGVWSATGNLGMGRCLPTATLLPTGNVLVTGGFADPGGTTGTAELYDPAIGTRSSAGSMSTPRVFHTATLLPNGKVLVATLATPVWRQRRCTTRQLASGPQRAA